MSAVLPGATSPFQMLPALCSNTIANPHPSGWPGCRLGYRREPFSRRSIIQKRTSRIREAKLFPKQLVNQTSARTDRSPRLHALRGLTAPGAFAARRT